MPNFEDDYYQRLQVSREATLPEIKAAFRRLARRYHPDLNPNNASAKEKFLALREAYEVLIDQVLRERYDQNHNPEEVYHVDDTPTTPQDFYRRGVSQALNREYKQAYRDYTEAIDQQPDFVAAYLRRAQVRYVLGDDAGVLADCQRLLKLDDPNAEVFYYQGLARYRLGYTQSAIAAFTEAIALDSDDPQAYYQRAIAHEDIQELDQALADLQRAQQYFEAQGDQHGVQRTQAHLEKLQTTFQTTFTASSAHLKRGRRLTWPKLGRLGRFNRLFFGLWGNPAGEITALHGQLSPQQATQTGCLLGTIAVTCFTLSGHVLRFSAPGLKTLGALWVCGSIAFLGLVLMLAFTRTWFHRRGRWSSDIFMAGATLLPVGLFALITPAVLIFGEWLWLLLYLFTATQTILSLYTSCTQIQHLSAQIAAWVVPSVLFISFSLAYLVLQIWI